MTPLVLLGGACSAALAREALRRALLAKLRADLRRLNEGDHRPLLAGYDEHAVLHFNTGPHRWSGPHQGRDAIDRFLRNFTRAGLRGDIRELWISGAPWALTAVVRFDDRAVDPGGIELYANRTVLLVRTRWGRIVEQEDFYEDTGRIDAFEAALTELGIGPVPRT